MEKVAELARTSASTVSRVLSGSASISAATTERVLAAARKVGYVPSRAARSLGRRRGGRGGIVHGRVAFAHLAGDRGRITETFGEIHEGILATSRYAGVSFELLLVSPDTDETVEVLRRAEVDGILFHSSFRFDSAELSAVAPAVIVGGPASVPCDFPVVEPDSHLGIESVMRYLHERGHRRIEFVCSTLETPVFRERAHAYLACMHGLGLPPRIIELGKATEEAAVKDLLGRAPAERPTALVTTHDGRAARMGWALMRQGVRIPEDVSVTGFDGLRSRSETCPHVTTWTVAWRELGRAALNLLLDRVRGGPSPTRVLIGGELTVGETVGPARE